MNDPHVVALIYRIHHGEHVDYSNASACETECDHFTIEVNGKAARATMNSHFARATDAQQAVEIVLRAWELDQALRYGLETIEFIYDRSEIVDRAPTPGHHSLIVEPIHYQFVLGQPKLTLHFSAFPIPAKNLKRDAVVDQMFERYRLYMRGETLLPEAAYFCLTIMENKCGGRDKASIHYDVEKAVLGKVGDLATNKGGPQARKAKGADVKYSDVEKRWLEDAMKALIRRVAEVAFGRPEDMSKITMSNLPPLS
jgi:hypothetical protein